MSAGVVDRLEPIEVAEGHRRTGASVIVHCQQTCQPGHDFVPVGQPGQSIGARAGVERLFGLDLGLDIAPTTDETDRLAVITSDRVDGALDPARPTVLGGHPKASAGARARQHLGGGPVDELAILGAHQVPPVATDEFRGRESEHALNSLGHPFGGSVQGRPVDHVGRILGKQPIPLLRRGQCRLVIDLVLDVPREDNHRRDNPVLTHRPSSRLQPPPTSIPTPHPEPGAGCLLTGQQSISGRPDARGVVAVDQIKQSVDALVRRPPQKTLDRR